MIRSNSIVKKYAQNILDCTKILLELCRIITGVYKIVDITGNKIGDLVLETDRITQWDVSLPS